MFEFINPVYLPDIFVCIISVTILAYVLLDGFDLGVGMLFVLLTPKERDRVLASIGPYWDANETWLVLAVMVLFVAFPYASIIIFNELYFAILIMIVALVVRGASYGFRAKVPSKYKLLCDYSFFLGSLITSLCQGYMLGEYIMGFNKGLAFELFSYIVAIFVAAGYLFLGAAWLIIKSKFLVKVLSVKILIYTLFVVLGGIIFATVITPILKTNIIGFELYPTFSKYIFILPCVSVGIIAFIIYNIKSLVRIRYYAYLPYTLASLVFLLCFASVAMSLYPYIIPAQMTIYEAVTHSSTLELLLVALTLVMPAIIIYNIYVYRVFRGKVIADLKYY